MSSRRVIAPAASLVCKVGKHLVTGQRCFHRNIHSIVVTNFTHHHDVGGSLPAQRKNAVKAALTGHQVLSTLHTNDAAGAITRLDDMGIEPFLISSSILMTCAQRLVRKICANCREEFMPEPEIFTRLKKLKLGDPKTPFSTVQDR